MFADRAKIYIRSGKGGDGHVSFRRELYVPNGGPDGGDGGRGGDVIFEVDKGLNTLVDFRHKTKYKAQDGEEGGKKRCHGKDAKDLILKVPEGTVIREAETNKVIADMSGENQRQVILKGGKGGLGNMHFATSTMQVPKYAQPGKPAQELWVNLELKVIADVGLVGFPNVGKSTFLSRVTNAQPKIANYHFTTLSPNLGVVDLEGAKGFVIADIPGLIEGASEGVGLGHEFLRHVERTKMMIHVVDAAGIEGRDPVEDIYKINAELEAYNKEISMRPQVIAANKVDLIYSEDEDPIQRLRDEFEPKGIKVFPISGVTGEGLSDLLYYVNNELQKLDDKPIVFEQEYFPEDELLYIDLPYTVEKEDNVYVQLSDFGWAYIGTWGALHDLLPKDEERKVAIDSNTMLYGCKNNLIMMPKDKLAVIQELEGYLVVEKDNVLLICRKDDQNAIRKFVNDVEMRFGEKYS